MANLKNMHREKKWIRKKLRSGISQEQLKHNVGVFSNKSKKKVMKQKKLSEMQYKARYRFLSNCYALLDFEDFS